MYRSDVPISKLKQDIEDGNLFTCPYCGCECEGVPWIPMVCPACFLEVCGYRKDGDELERLQLCGFNPTFDW